MMPSTNEAKNIYNKDIRSLYNTVYIIKKLSMKHHFEMLPKNISLHIMPEFNLSQLEN